MPTKRIDAIATLRFIVPPGTKGVILPEAGRIENDGMQVNRYTALPLLLFVSVHSKEF
jgi:hypothetical protein